MAGPAIPIRLLGTAARRALEASHGGSVLAVFRRSCYVQLGPGALVCLGGPGLGRGPINASCAPSLPDRLDRALAPEMPVMVRHRLVVIAGRWVLDWAEAASWRPARVCPGWTATDLAAGLATLAETTPPEGTLGRLIPTLAGTAPGDDDPLSRVAWPAVLALRGWLGAVLGGAGGDPPVAAARLLGLGPGLTPAGDDLLGGAMIALHMLGAKASAGRLAAWALPRTATRTGRISRAHLAAAAEGEGAGALHDVVATLTTPGTPLLDAHLGALARVGHGSGFDALTGVVLAAVAWLEAHGNGDALRVGRDPCRGRASAPPLGHDEHSTDPTLGG